MAKGSLDFMDTLTLLGTAVALGMDAFAVAIGGCGLPI
jgi:putative Mn2+ efflux pump MntP